MLPPRLRRTVILALVGWLALLPCLHARPFVQRLIAPPAGSGPAPYAFLLSLPEGYDAVDAKPWPLLIFLHGSRREVVDLRNLEALITLGPPKLIEEGPHFAEVERPASVVLKTKFVVMSPQCQFGEGWDDERLIATLDFLLPKMKIDRTRIYVTGASMGGRGTWLLATLHPERFAAVAPVCGRGSARTVRKAKGEQLEQLRRLPIWAFHNDRDPTVPLWESEAMVKAFKAIGAPEVKFTVYPSQKHDAWSLAYRDVELYAWLLQHSLPSGKAPTIERDHN